jgi:hypothetical protein
MPRTSLAVLKRKASELPVTFALDDSTAMAAPGTPCRKNYARGSGSACGSCGASILFSQLWQLLG